MKRFVAFLMASVMLLTLLASCAKDGGEEETTIETEEIAQEILLADLSHYTIVYPEGGMSVGLNKKIMSFQVALEEQFGVRVETKDDFLNENMGIVAGDCEILIGDTNRAESRAVYAELEKVNDFEVRLVGKKLVVAAWSDGILMTALDSLQSALQELPKNSPSFFHASMQISHRAQYPMDRLL